MANRKQAIDYTLFGVTTVAEAATCWQKNRKTVERAIDKGYIRARQVEGGNTILISVSSLVSHWGDPRRNLGGQEVSLPPA